MHYLIINCVFMDAIESKFELNKIYIRREWDRAEILYDGEGLWIDTCSLFVPMGLEWNKKHGLCMTAILGPDSENFVKSINTIYEHCVNWLRGRLPSSTPQQHPIQDGKIFLRCPYSRFFTPDGNLIHLAALKDKPVKIIPYCRISRLKFDDGIYLEIDIETATVY